MAWRPIRKNVVSGNEFDLQGYQLVGVGTFNRELNEYLTKENVQALLGGFEYPSKAKPAVDAFLDSEAKQYRLYQYFLKVTPNSDFLKEPKILANSTAPRYAIGTFEYGVIEEIERNFKFVDIINYFNDISLERQRWYAPSLMITFSMYNISNGQLMFEI